MAEQTTEETGYAPDQVRFLLLDEVNRLYEEQGEAAAHTFCVKRHAIASVCMSCTRLFRVVDSRGTSGGLSHGWCSARCVQLGATRAEAG